MVISRRKAVLTTLFGAGAVGLRTLASGLPLSILANPRKAFADMGDAGDAGPVCASPSQAQFIIMSTSASGDPINTNCPGAYLDPNIMHPSDPSMAPTPLTIGSTQYTAAKPWSTLPANVLARTCFFHMMTNTFIHPDEPTVLELMGATGQREMLPSLLAKALAPCLNTIQTQPLAIGASGPSEALSFDGATLPITPPVSLKDTLANPTGPLTQLQPLRDQALDQIYAAYKSAATTDAQRAYIDSLVTSQTQIRAISQSLLGSLASIKDNSIASQIQAAITLIQMKISPVITINIPFGGDNHQDTNLAAEVAGNVAGVASIVSLMSQLQSANLQDQVTFTTLNVFGRTMAQNGQTGRGHNGMHHVSVCIGKPFAPSVIGGITPVTEFGTPDFGCNGIQSTTGAATSSGDIQPIDTLAAYGQTMLAAVGGDPSLVTGGTVVTAALAS